MAVMQEQTSDQSGDDELRPREGRHYCHVLLKVIAALVLRLRL